MSHPLANTSFEDPGTTPGSADQWTPLVTDTAESSAAFTHSDLYTRSQDDFEDSWESNQLAQTGFDATDLVSALFEDNAYQQESFEFSWREPVDTAPVAYNHQSSFTFDLSNFSGTDDDFETNWGNSPYNQSSVTDLAGATTSAASFAGDAYEDYEADWGVTPYNQGAIDDYAGGTFDTADFYIVLGTLPYDSFENLWIEALP